METTNRHNDSITTPRLLDTTLCPFSTTKKSLAHTYNNQSIYMGSIDKDYGESIITDCQSKLKIRKIIMDAVPECIKQPTRRLLSRVGENNIVLDSLLKFYKSIVPVINKLQTQIQLKIQQNSKIRSEMLQQSYAIRSQKHITQTHGSRQNQLQLKIQKLQSTIHKFIHGDIQPQQLQEGRVPIKSQQNPTVNAQKKALALAIQQMAKLQQQKDNYSYMLNTFKQQIQRLKQQNKKQQAIPEHYRINDDIEALKLEVEQLKRFRQLFYMCRQQKIYIQSCHNIDNTRARHNEKQIRKLKEKLLNLSSLIGRGDFQLLQNQEKDAIQKIKQEIINNAGFKKCTQQEFKMIEKYESQVEVPEPTEAKYHEQLKLYYPTFFNLLTQQIKQFEVQLKISFNKAVNSDLFLRIRAIMDSKYNELMVQPQESCTRFTDFVFGWFQRFDVNNETKRIVQHSKPRVQSQYNKKHFLIGLYNPKIEKLNEILTFRQFLLGQSPQDQIYYYLQCRAMFFKGSQLDYISSSSDTVVFLQHQHVLKQVGILINKFPKQVQNIIIYNINLKRKKKYNEYFIDVAFVLRTLLEVYRAYKRQKYQKMRLVMMKLQNTLGTKQIKFVYFRELVELNFPKISVSRLAFMYRELMNVYKNNNIDFFGAFYSSSHQKLFISTIKQDLQKIPSIQTRSFLNISATLPSTLGLQSLFDSLKSHFSTTIPDLFTQTHLTLKIIRLLSTKQQNKQSIFDIKQHLKICLQSNIQDIKKMTQNMKNKDQKIQAAAHRLTRAFRYRIKLYYDKFLQRINNKIQQVNRSSHTK